MNRRFQWYKNVIFVKKSIFEKYVDGDKWIQVVTLNCIRQHVSWCKRGIRSPSCFVTSQLVVFILFGHQRSLLRYDVVNRCPWRHDDVITSPRHHRAHHRVVTNHRSRDHAVGTRSRCNRLHGDTTVGNGCCGTGCFRRLAATCRRVYGQRDGCRVDRRGSLADGRGSLACRRRWRRQDESFTTTTTTTKETSPRPATQL